MSLTLKNQDSIPVMPYEKAKQLFLNWTRISLVQKGLSLILLQNMMETSEEKSKSTGKKSSRRWKSLASQAKNAERSKKSSEAVGQGRDGDGMSQPRKRSSVTTQEVKLKGKTKFI